MEESSFTLDAAQQLLRTAVFPGIRQVIANYITLSTPEILQSLRLSLVQFQGVRDVIASNLYATTTGPNSAALPATANTIEALAFLLEFEQPLTSAFMIMLPYGSLDYFERVLQGVIAAYTVQWQTELEREVRAQLAARQLPKLAQLADELEKMLRNADKVSAAKLEKKVMRWQADMVVVRSLLLGETLLVGVDIQLSANSQDDVRSGIAVLRELASGARRPTAADFDLVDGLLRRLYRLAFRYEALKGPRPPGTPTFRQDAKMVQTCLLPPVNARLHVRRPAQTTNTRGYL